ncbi:phage terminase small subunit [Actinomyces provencensis]|uniref:phage terminase small subunit n=1 Tax=Actinomyces provencensis TaxID=1720198 RepID=UPI001E54EB0A|nr:hypothetical protein [Actinomyces provencensis]
MGVSRNMTKRNSRAYRENGAKAAVLLPAGGSELPVPAIPPQCKETWNRAQKARWKELWESPQASQWDESCRGTVAALVAYEDAILTGAASAWMAQEARYASEALGLTPRAMAALGWVIDDAGASGE